jgi:hypothetical protein
VGDQTAVLTVDHRHQLKLAGKLQRVEEVRGVALKPHIDHEELDARVAVGGERADLGQARRAGVEQHRVQHEVNDALLQGHALVAIHRLRQGLARRGKAHVADGRHPAGGGRPRAAGEVVDPHRLAALAKPGGG